MYALVNGKIFDGDKFLDNKVLLIENDKIVKISNVIPEGIEVIDLKGKIVTSGFIDNQINGCGGVLFNDEISLKTLNIMKETNLKSGTTSFLPTLITTIDENIEKALELFKNTEDMEEYGVLGLHIEGPYISLEKKGIHNPKFIRVMSDEIIKKIAEHGKYIKTMTIAPEKAKVEHLDMLKKSGIPLAIGHTNATYDEVMEKISYYSNVTHLFNAMRGLDTREPGVIGAVFENKNLYSGIIVDGIHVHFKSVKIAKEILGDKLYLVTDAVAPTGTNMEFFMFEGNKVLYKDGKCISPDGTLGGSSLTMIEGVQNLVKHVGLTVEEALRMATSLPAKAIGVENRFGFIKENYEANLVVLTENLEIDTVIFRGKRV